KQETLKRLAAVNSVTDNRVTKRSQVDAQLMSPTGRRPQLQQAEGSTVNQTLLQQSVLSLGRFAAGARPESLRPLWVALNRHVNYGLSVLWLTADDGGINLPGFALRKLLLQPA